MSERRADVDLLSSLSSANISPATEHLYRSALRRVVRIVSASRDKVVELSWILRHPRRSFAALEDAIPNRASLRTTVASVLALLKHSGAKHEHRDLFRRWYSIYEPLRVEVEDAEVGAPAAGRLLAGAVSWTDVVSAREQLARSAFASREHVLLSFFTLLAPRRQADYFRVRILGADERPASDEPAFLELARGRLVVRAYKTAKTYDTWVKDIPDALLRILHSSLRAEPREFLFVDSHGQPFRTPNAFTQFSNRVLKRVIGPHVTLNSLRHAASKASLADPNKTLRDKQAYASDMGHSFGTHMRYDKVIPRNSA